MNIEVSMQSRGSDQHGGYMGRMHLSIDQNVCGQPRVAVLQLHRAAVICHSTCSLQVTCMQHPPCTQASTAKDDGDDVVLHEGKTIAM